MTKASPRINLHKLIILLTLFFVSITFISVLYANYQEQKKLLIKNTLSADLFYATALAETADNVIGTLQYQIGLYVPRLPKHFNDTTFLQNEIDDLHKISRRLNAVQLVSNNGIVLASSSFDVKLPQDYATADLTMNMREEKKPIVTVSAISNIDPLVLNIAEPLFDEKNHYIGYINGLIFLQKDNLLYTILNNHRYSNGANIYLIDRQGHILNHEDSSQLGHTIPETPITKALADNRSGMMEFNDGHLHVLAGYAPIKRLQWGAIVQHPMSTTLTILFPLMLSTVLKTFPLLLIFFIGIWYLSKQIAHPLWKLALQARTMDKPNAKEAVEKIHAWYFEAEQLKKSMLQGLKRVDTKIDRLSRESLTDPLTGLINRRGIYSSLAQWGHIPYTVLFIDIDHFKNVNDTFGHEAGDITLQTLAAQMRLNFRPNDLLCRFGGEEFLIFLPMTTLDGAYQIAERFRTIIENYPFREVKHITISIGIASNEKMTSVSLEDIVKSADDAMYQAKNDGRNRTIKFDLSEIRSTS